MIQIRQKGYKLGAWLFILNLLFLSACFSTPPVEEHFYFLDGPRAATEKGYGHRIQVSDFSSTAGYDTSRIAYRTGPHELRYYAYKQWVAEPSRMLSEMTVRLLRASGRFTEVARGEKLREPDAIVEAIVDAIEEVDQENAWQARLAMTFNVRKGDSDRVLFRHAFDLSLPCAKGDLGEVAKNISALLAQEVEKLGQRLVKNLRK